MAILTDAFPAHQRGFALGINNVAGISGQFIGLVLGGLLAAVDWRLVFLDLGAARDRRDDLVARAACARSASTAGEDRLVGQRHLRAAASSS